MKTIFHSNISKKLLINIKIIKILKTFPLSKKYKQILIEKEKKLLALILCDKCKKPCELLSDYTKLCKNKKCLTLSRNK